MCVCVLTQSAIGCGEHCVLKNSVCVAWLVCGNGIFIKGKRGVALLPFSVVLYVPDFVFLNVLRLRHLETSFCSCLRLLCQPWDFCNLNLICQNKICSEIVASYPRVRACLTSVTVRLSRFFPNSFASITMVFGPYSKRWAIVRQCFNTFWTMNTYRMTRANFVNSIIHSKTIWFMQSEVFLTCRGWNSQAIGFVWVFWTRTGKTGFRLTHVYLS